MDILRAVKEGVEKPRQIMYKANISWAILQIHLKSLVENGFLTEIECGSRRRYELTQKGFNIYAHTATFLSRWVKIAHHSKSLREIFTAPALTISSIARILSPSFTSTPRTASSSRYTLYPLLKPSNTVCFTQ